MCWNQCTLTLVSYRFSLHQFWCDVSCPCATRSKGRPSRNIGRYGAFYGRRGVSGSTGGYYAQCLGLLMNGRWRLALYKLPLSLIMENIPNPSSLHHLPTSSVSPKQPVVIKPRARWCSWGSVERERWPRSWQTSPGVLGRNFLVIGKTISKGRWMKLNP